MGCIVSWIRIREQWNCMDEKAMELFLKAVDESKNVQSGLDVPL